MRVSLGGYAAVPMRKTTIKSWVTIFHLIFRHPARRSVDGTEVPTAHGFPPTDNPLKVCL